MLDAFREAALLFICLIRIEHVPFFWLWHFSPEVSFIRIISPRVGDAVLKDESLARLARMNPTYQGFGDPFSAYNRAVTETALREYAINALPNPPELLSKEYALSVLNP